MTFDPLEKVKCDVCDILVSKRNWSKHKGTLSHHNKMNGTFVRPGELRFCETCQKDYAACYEKNHVRSTTDKKFLINFNEKYYCDVCEKSMLLRERGSHWSDKEHKVRQGDGLQELDT